MAQKPEKQTYAFSFQCVKSSHRFQVETEDSDMKKFDVPKMRCPVCQDVVQFSASNFPVGDGKAKSMENRRKENEGRSKMAMELARKHTVENPPPEMVSLQFKDVPGKGGGGVFNRPEQVPKSVIEKIQEKVEPFL